MLVAIVTRRKLLLSYYRPRPHHGSVVTACFSSRRKRRPSSSVTAAATARRTFSASSDGGGGGGGGGSAGTTDQSPANRNDPTRIKQDKAYCVNLVKERDGEGYLCGLLMPAASRDSFFALRAFNVELASIKDAHHLRNQGTAASTTGLNNSNNVPDSTLALQLRMQWWRDAVGEIYDTSEGSASTTAAAGISSSNLSISCWNSPVVRSLARAHEQCHWTRRFLERIIDARELDLEKSQYETVNALASYAEHTVGSLLYLTLEACRVRDDAADQCASHAGLGVGLTTALRATPYRLAAGGEVPLPAELLRPGFPYHQLVPEFLGAADPEDSETPHTTALLEEDTVQWREAVQVVATTAMHHLMRAREQQSAVPKQARATLLPVVPALQYLEKLERAEYNVFDPRLMTGSQSDRLRLLLLLGRTWMTGIF